MRLSKKLRALAMVCLTMAVCVIGREARADSYNTYQLYQSSGSVDNIGLTDSGSLTVFSALTFQYTTFTPPSTYKTSPTLPAFTFDNGSACSVSVAGLSINAATDKCNNGRAVFQASSSTDPFALYLLDGNVLQMLYDGATANLLLDANGDVAFVGLNYSVNLNDTNYLYYDTSSRAAVTPEPSSLILLLTGGMGTAAMWRRRLRAKA